MPGTQPGATRQTSAGTERVIHRAVGHPDRGADSADRDCGRPRLRRQLFHGIKDLILVIYARTRHCDIITERSLCNLGSWAMRATRPEVFPFTTGKLIALRRLGQHEVQESHMLRLLRLGG